MTAPPPRAAPEALSTARLSLRRFHRSEEPTLTALYSKPSVMQFIVPGGRTPEQSRAACERLFVQWETCGFGAWLLTAQDDGRFAGVCMLMRDAGTGSVEAGYALDDAFWGRGLATEVVQALIGIAFDWLDLPGLFARVDPPNLASIRVLEKNGFTLAAQSRPPGGRATDWFRLVRKGREIALPIEASTH
jgi:[ribosomal protein S5]-alanine N-acetyltransferase